MQQYFQSPIPFLRPLLLPLLLPLLGAAATAQAMLAVSPSDRTTLEGSSYTHFPLGRASTRMQTLHSDVPGGTLLSGHAYRRDAVLVRDLVDPFSSDLQVRLSMSPKLPTQASTTFANNAGSNPVLVLPRTFLAFPATHRPTIDPAATFELVVPYQVPFLVPPSGGTLCVDVEVFGNQSASGTNQNLSVYLDSHENYTNGQAEQPGFRTGLGCPAPGQTVECYASMTLWWRTTGMQLDISIRNGVHDSGNGLTRGFVTIGNSLAGAPWPSRPDCPFWSSSEVWFALPGTMNAQGNYDGSLTALPTLPPGYRLWFQAGSIDLGTVDMAFGDATTLITPPPGPQPIPTSRIINSTNVAAATGTVSYAVPVMGFF
ncbi:MAG: hypothetical protein ABIP94_09635 [Planctomycetota bacterium]